MKYRQDLQVKLQERYRRLAKASMQTYSHDARYLIQFILDTPALLFAVEAIEREEPELDPADWVEHKISWNQFSLPETEPTSVRRPDTPT